MNFIRLTSAKDGLKILINPKAIQVIAHSEETEGTLLEFMDGFEIPVHETIPDIVMCLEFLNDAFKGERSIVVGLVMGEARMIPYNSLQTDKAH